jgi:hypothetical protein
MTQPHDPSNMPHGAPVAPPHGPAGLALSAVAALLFGPMFGVMRLSDDPLWQRLSFGGFGLLVLAMGAYGMSLGIQASSAGERPAWIGTTATIVGALVLVAVLMMGFKVL